MASTKPTLAVLVEQRLSVLADAWKWLQNRSKITQRNRSLRVCESAQLGEKRIIALIQADDQRFLIGGTSNSITLLATLTSLEDFRSLLPKDALSEVQE
jgi:flagellar biogenesis protein FliO